MRLIDAEYVLWKVQSEAFPQSVDFGQGRESVLEEIRKAPTVDAEPVVRCKDCKHYTSMWYCEAWNNSPGFPAVRDDMFCSLAERRDDE